MICPNCGAQLQEDDAFCCHCGYKVEKPAEEPKVDPILPDEKPTGAFCPNCGNAVNKNDAFCMRCGYRLQAPAPCATEIPDLSVPVGDAGFVKQGQPETICRMCGCKIPADSRFCPICQQPVVQSAPYAPRITPIYQTQPVAKKKPFNVMALLGFIFGLLGLLGTLSDGSGVLLAIPGLVLGILGLVKSKKTGAGKGFAIAGIVLSGVAIAIFALMVVVELFDAFSYSPSGTESVYPDSGADSWGNGNLY